MRIVFWGVFSELVHERMKRSRLELMYAVNGMSGVELTLFQTGVEWIKSRKGYRSIRCWRWSERHHGGTGPPNLLHNSRMPLLSPRSPTSRKVDSNIFAPLSFHIDTNFPLHLRCQCLKVLGKGKGVGAVSPHPHETRHKGSCPPLISRPY